MKSRIVRVRELSSEGSPKAFDERIGVTICSEIVDVEYFQSNLLSSSCYLRESQIAIYENCAQLLSATDSVSKHQIDLSV